MVGNEPFQPAILSSTKQLQQSVHRVRFTRNYTYYVVRTMFRSNKRSLFPMRRTIINDAPYDIRLSRSDYGNRALDA